MSDTTASLERKISTAGDLQSVVRTMKAVAASNIGQYERAVASLNDYYRTVQLALVASLHQRTLHRGAAAPPSSTGSIAAVVFGSDQGLVGQFNDAMVDFVAQTLEDLPGQKTILPVGERIQSRFAETDFLQGKSFILPRSIDAITPLVGQVLIEIEALQEEALIAQVYVFHNSPHAGAVYAPTVQRLLPLDHAWQQGLTAISWPTKNLPQVMHDDASPLLAFVSEYLFVSLFRACAESLASENASRLSAMQRAEKNIDELLEELGRTFHLQRQRGLDEELFDVVAGFEALTQQD